MGLAVGSSSAEGIGRSALDQARDAVAATCREAEAFAAKFEPTQPTAGTAACRRPWWPAVWSAAATDDVQVGGHCWPIVAVK